MQIKFATSEIERLCSDETTAIKNLGSTCAKKLQRYISMLCAAETVADLPKIGHLHDLKGDRSSQKAFSLDRKMRLVFAPGNDPKPLKEDGSVDWVSVTIVRIEYIGNYHD